MGTLLLISKALHIVGAVAWFGGLFYLVRIFVYHVEAFDKGEPDRSILIKQFELMEDRVYRIICIPGMLITWIFGCVMIAVYLDTQGMAWFGANPWLHVKLFLVVLLSGYQHSCKSIIRKLKSGVPVFTSFKMRLYNEVPTLFLVSIVLLAVSRSLARFGEAFLAIILFAVVLILFTKWYKRVRNDN